MLEMKYDVSFSQDTIFFSMKFFDGNVSIPLSDPSACSIFEVFKNKLGLINADGCGPLKSLLIGLGQADELLECVEEIQRLGHADASMLRDALETQTRYCGIEEDAFSAPRFTR